MIEKNINNAKLLVAFVLKSNSPKTTINECWNCWLFNIAVVLKSNNIIYDI